MDLLDRMLGHDRWTTERLLTISRDLTDAQLDQEFDIGHRTLRKTFKHMIGNLEFWTGVMQGTPRPPDASANSIDDLLAAHAAAFDEYERLARELVANDRLDDTYVDHYAYRQSYGGTIVHLAYHHVGHRSEVLHILQRLGVDDLPEGDPQEWEHMTDRIADARQQVPGHTPLFDD